VEVDEGANTTNESGDGDHQVDDPATSIIKVRNKSVAGNTSGPCVMVLSFTYNISESSMAGDFVRVALGEGWESIAQGIEDAGEKGSISRSDGSQRKLKLVCLPVVYAAFVLSTRSKLRSRRARQLDKKTGSCPPCPRDGLCAGKLQSRLRKG